MLALAGKSVAQLHRAHLGAHLAAAAFISSSPSLTRDSPPAHPRRVSPASARHTMYSLSTLTLHGSSPACPPAVSSMRRVDQKRAPSDEFLAGNEGRVHKWQHSLFPSVLPVRLQLSSLARTGTRVDLLHEQAKNWPVLRPPMSGSCQGLLPSQTKGAPLPHASRILEASSLLFPLALESPT